MVTKAGKSSWLSHLHFYLRVLGLLGLLSVIFGIILAFIFDAIPTWKEIPNQLLSGIQGKSDDAQRDQILSLMIVVGLTLSVLALIVEIISTMRFSAARRTLFGLNVGVQVVLALALFVGINVYSFQNYERLDYSRDQRFTLPEDLVQQLRKLQRETTIVLLQQKSREELSGTQQYEDYETAAEDVVVEKVYDLVDQLREFGPRFKVEVFDAGNKEFRNKLQTLQEEKPKLAEAIQKAPESSIFFYAKSTADEQPHIQRLAFRDFYQLDRTRSLRADNDKGNLVLLDKGVRPFIRRILSLENRRPVVGVLVSHPALTTVGRFEEFSQGGVREVLERHGFEVKDIILKEWNSGGVRPPQPAAQTVEELRYLSRKREKDRLAQALNDYQKDKKTLSDLIDLWTKSTLDELTKKYQDRLQGQRVTEAFRQRQLFLLKQNYASVLDSLQQIPVAMKQIDEAINKMPVKELKERVNIADAIGKLRRSLAECDLLLLPRLTMRGIGDPPVPMFVHNLEQSQVDVIKEALKRGTPLLASLGPTTPYPAIGTPPPGPNRLEDMLSDLGIRFGTETVLFEEDAKEQSDQQISQFLVLRQSEVPGLNFDTSPTSLYQSLDNQEIGPVDDHPLFKSFQVTQSVLGEDLKLRFRQPRPLYYVPTAEQRIRSGLLGALIAHGSNGAVSTLTATALAQTNFSPAIFLLTHPKSWKDDQPFRENPQPPRLNEAGVATKPERTLEDRVRGPLPVAVAVDTSVPSSWYAQGDSTSPSNVRVAVIGSGAVFHEELSAAQSRLLLDTINWLLEREDLLNREAKTWTWSRVQLDETTKSKALWSWGVCVGLPMAFAFLGMIVLLRRKVR